MNDARIPKLIYEWELEGERQPMSWKQVKYQIMKDLDITTEKPQDRDRWRTVISGMRN